MRTFIPPGARVADVRDFGAVSGQDCSAAFQNAYLWAQANSGRFANPKIVYVPDGEWLLSYPVLGRIGSADAWTNPTLTAIGKVSLHDGWRAGMIFVGQSTAGTRMIVPANSPGFQNGSAPIGVFTTGSERGAGGQRDPNPAGGGNIAFYHGVYNVTIIIEAGNPGAIGLDMVVTNRGGASNIRIVDAGGSAFAGLSFHRVGSGPAYYKNITVEGFNYGIWQGRLDGGQLNDYHLTFENLTLINQRILGIRINGLTTSYRGLISYNSVPVFTNLSKRTNTTITNATLYPVETIAKGAMVGRSPQALQPATGIVNMLGELYLKNITNLAYETTYEDRSITPPRTGTGNINDYFTRLTAFATFTAPTRLNLRVLDAPIFESETLADYANVEDYGANGLDSNVNSTAAIQAAIDSGKPITYLPNGVYLISAPIILRGNCHKLIGYTARILKAPSMAASDPAIIFADGTAPFTCIEHLRFDNILHDCQRTLVIRHARPEYIRNTANSIGGRTFVEDIMGFINADHPHDFWCRQLDSEFEPYNLKITGGSCWVHGLKTEADGLRPEFSTNIYALKGARVQVESAHMYPLHAIPARIAAIEIDEAKVQCNFRLGTGTYSTVIRERRAGVTRTLRAFNTSQFRSQL